MILQLVYFAASTFLVWYRATSIKFEISKTATFEFVELWLLAFFAWGAALARVLVDASQLLYPLVLLLLLVSLDKKEPIRFVGCSELFALLIRRVVFVRDVIETVSHRPVYYLIIVIHIISKWCKARLSFLSRVELRVRSHLADLVAIFGHLIDHGWVTATRPVSRSNTQTLRTKWWVLWNIVKAAVLILIILIIVLKLRPAIRTPVHIVTPASIEALSVRIMRAAVVLMALPCILIWVGAHLCIGLAILPLTFDRREYWAIVVVQLLLFFQVTDVLSLASHLISELLSQFLLYFLDDLLEVKHLVSWNDALIAKLTNLMIVIVY